MAGPTTPTAAGSSNHPPGRPIGSHQMRIKEALPQLLKLAMPIILVQVGMRTMGIVDAVMVGHISSADLAAVALGDFYFFTVVVFSMGLLMALDPLIAQAVGADDRRAMALGIQRGVFLAVTLGAGSALLLIPGMGVFTALGQPPEIIPVAAAYAIASIPGTIPFNLFVAFRQVLQAIGRVGPIVTSIAIANLANVFFNWVLIFGHLGAPRMGAVGSGWASSISRWVMALSLVAISWPHLKEYLLPIRPNVITRPAIMRMFAIGAPIGLQLQLEFGAFGVTALLMGLLGSNAIASHQIAITLASLTFMVPVGIGMSAAVLVGRAVGRRNQADARGAAGAALIAGTTFMAASAAVMLAIPELIARGYTSDPAVITIAATLIPIAGVFQVFDGVQVVSGGILRGLADTRVPMVIGIVGFWILGVPAGYYLGFGRDMGPAGLWWGLVVGLGTVSVFLLARVVKQLRKNVDRVRVD